MAYLIAQMNTAIGTVHGDSTTETSIARKAFAIGELQPGKIYGFECGIIVSSSNSTDTLVAAVRFGSSSTVTSNTAIATSAAVDVANGDVSLVRGTLHVHTATRIVFGVTCPDVDAVMTIADKSTVVVFTSVADTAYYLDVTLDWSVASASNVAAASHFAVWEIS